MDHRKKYLKYKKKYNLLKNNINLFTKKTQYGGFVIPISCDLCILKRVKSKKNTNTGDCLHQCLKSMFTKKIKNKETDTEENIYETIYNYEQYPEIYGTKNHYIEELIKTFGDIDKKQKNLDIEHLFNKRWDEPLFKSKTNDMDKIKWCIDF